MYPFPAARTPIPASPAFEALVRGAQFRDRIAVRVTAPAAAIFRAAREVTLSDMPLARMVGEIRYLPSRLGGHPPDAPADKPFLSVLTEGGTLVLRDDTPREIITGSAGRLHRIVDQASVLFADCGAFDRFADPGFEKLFMSLRVAPTGIAGEHWLILEHATRALSPAAAQKFARYWLAIKPGGAFVSRQLLKAIRTRAERGGATAVGIRRATRRHAVRATFVEATRTLPGDGLIATPKGVLTHAITIHRPPRDVWPWLAQMGAGSRAGWYSYDFLDNGRRPSAAEIVPALQELSVGMIFPALPGETTGFAVLAFEAPRFLVIGWLPPREPGPLMTWAFVLEGAPHESTRLIVRARAGAAYDFYGLPWWLGKRLASALHFVMQRKQLLGIAARAERSSAGSRGAPAESGQKKAAA